MRIRLQLLDHSRASLVSSYNVPNVLLGSEMSLQLWLVYCVAAIGLSLTPGPNGLLVLSHGMRYGLRRTVFTAFGGVSGFFVLVAASLAGLGALLAASEQAFTITKWIGGAYLVYLGIRTWRAPAPVVAPLEIDASKCDAAPDDFRDLDRKHSPNLPRSSRQLNPTNRELFREGFLVAVSNPKALIFFAAFLPQFMQAGVPYWLQLIMLGGTFTIVEFVYELIVAGAAQRVAPWLGRNGKIFNRIAGGTFIAIGAMLTRAGPA